eukprot:1895035-Prymnesium_polylepis.1
MHARRERDCGRDCAVVALGLLSSRGLAPVDGDRLRAGKLRRRGGHLEVDDEALRTMCSTHGEQRTSSTRQKRTTAAHDGSGSARQQRTTAGHGEQAQHASRSAHVVRAAAQAHLQPEPPARVDLRRAVEHIVLGCLGGLALRATEMQRETRVGKWQCQA